MNNFPKEKKKLTTFHIISIKITSKALHNNKIQAVIREFEQCLYT